MRHQGRKKRGRPCKGEERSPSAPTRLERQVDLPFDEAFCELPTDCDFGIKRDTDGNTYRWRGYKAHISWGDNMMPLDCFTSSASLHDSQVAIPLMKRLATCVTSCYDLMDSAYDADSIYKVSEALGHVAIIDKNERRGKKRTDDKPVACYNFVPAERIRYRERSNAERGNSRLKESFGLRFVRVRGHDKVHLHIMFGIVALFADQLLKPIL